MQRAQTLPSGLRGVLVAATLTVTALSPAHAASSADLNALLDQSSSAKSGNDFLPPEQAFRLSASADGSDRVRLIWAIAPGYYLYRDRIKIASTDPKITLGAPQFPQGITKTDEYFGKQVIYHTELNTLVPVVRSSPGTHNAALAVTYQGCAEAGLCYPPVTRQLTIELPNATAPSPAGSAASGSRSGGFVSEQDRLATLLESGNLLAVLLKFFGGGLLLAFTPCVLPMVPILSGLIVGQGTRVTTSRAFLLSLTYVMGMALTYTITGAAFAAAGQQVQAVFQQPWIIALFAAMFVAMALSMFGFYTVQMPSFIQTRLAQASNRQRSGSFGGVAVMGMLSALIVTTCVGPVLVAALIVIGQTGDILRGAAALFAMGLGMGAPLLVVGSSAGRWLPRAGAWMDGVKMLFGVMMLALAAWMLSRIVPGRVSLLLFAIPAFAATAVFWRFGNGARTVWLARTAAILFAVYGGVLLLGGQRGSDDLLMPLARHPASQAEPAFINISSVSQLQREVQAAAAAHQPVMLDFYADWCTSCKEMQRYTFTDPQVRSAMQSVRLLRADVTANNADDQALLHAFQIYGPPTIAFYDAQGREHHEFRVVGYMKASEFSALLHQALSAG